MPIASTQLGTSSTVLRPLSARISSSSGCRGRRGVSWPASSTPRNSRPSSSSSRPPATGAKSSRRPREYEVDRESLDRRCRPRPSGRLELPSREPVSRLLRDRPSPPRRLRRRRRGSPSPSRSERGASPERAGTRPPYPVGSGSSSASSAATAGGRATAASSRSRSAAVPPSAERDLPRPPRRPRRRRRRGRSSSLSPATGSRAGPEPLPPSRETPVLNASLSSSRSSPSSMDGRRSPSSHCRSSRRWLRSSEVRGARSVVP